MWFPLVLLGIAWLVMPVWALVVALRSESELARLRERVRLLEAAGGRALAAVPPPGVAPAIAPPPPLPLPLPGSAPPPAAAPGSGPTTAPSVASAQAASGSLLGARLGGPLERPAGATPGHFFDSAHAEELVGGLWLQNVGAVLLLLGAFFSIVWGYTSGHLGPGMLVLAGVLFGLALAWRGDRLSRRLPPLGHALIGVGLGVVFLAIYLGWFTLHVLPTAAAVVLLMLVALGTVAVGLHYRAQSVAALGVLGAFVPQLLSSLLQMRGFDLAAPALLGYLALVVIAVAVLTARAGWALLDLAALLLTTMTWIATFPRGDWGWGLEIGLGLLFAGAGLAPVVRLARTDAPARAAELAVILLAPLMFAAVSWPFIGYVGRAPAAMLLLTLSAVYVAAAWWIDTRRERDDGWRPLSAAATLFLMLALERAAGADYVSLAWLTEGAALAWLGSGRRGAWLRGCGAVVSVVGGMVHVATLVHHTHAMDAELPFVHPQALRVLGGIVLLIVTGALLRRESRFGEAPRRLLARAWVLAATALLLVYWAMEAQHLAQALAGTGGRWAQPPDLGAVPGPRRAEMLFAFFTSALWTVQAAALVALGWRRSSGFLRWTGLALLGITVLKFAIGDLANVDVFWRFVSAVLVGVVLLSVSFFYQRRIRRERA